MIDRDLLIQRAMENLSGDDLIIDSSIAGLIDHTLLRPDATEGDIIHLCEEAKNYGFFGVCVQPYWVSLARRLLKYSNVKVITVCGFPDGANITDVKIQEARMANIQGADEIDMVMNIGAFKSGEFSIVVDDIKKVKRALKPGTILKVIIETPLLSEEEIIKASILVREGGADFVKTGTGRIGAVKVRDVEVIKKAVDLPVKAAGGIRTMGFASELLKAGAERLGTSGSTRVASS